MRLAGTNITIPKPKYRSEIGIIVDMLDVIASSGRQGINVSAISRIANVSYNAINQKCQKLVAAGFIELQKTRKKSIYFITPPGIEFFERLRKFTDTMKAMNIRY